MSYVGGEIEWFVVFLLHLRCLVCVSPHFFESFVIVCCCSLSLSSFGFLAICETLSSFDVLEIEIQDGSKDCMFFFLWTTCVNQQLSQCACAVIGAVFYDTESRRGVLPIYATSSAHTEHHTICSHPPPPSLTLVIPACLSPFPL